MRRLALCAFAAGICMPMFVSLRGQSIQGLFPEQTAMKGLVSTFYREKETSPAITVRIGEIFTDYERKGFFRIGALPIEVLDAVKIEIHIPGPSTNRLDSLNDWPEKQATKRVELRNVTITSQFEGMTNRLDCARIRLLADGKWELLDRVVYISGTNQVSASRATMQVTGENSGMIAMQGRNPASFNFFTDDFKSRSAKE